MTCANRGNNLLQPPRSDTYASLLSPGKALSKRSPSIWSFITAARLVADCSLLFALTKPLSSSFSAVKATFPTFLSLFTFRPAGWDGGVVLRTSPVSLSENTLTGLLVSPRKYRFDSPMIPLLLIRKVFRSIETKYITPLMYAAIFSPRFFFSCLTELFPNATKPAYRHPL